MAGGLKFDQWQDGSGNVRTTVLQTMVATTGFTNQTITSSTPVAVTGLSVTITPKFATSKIIIEACLHSSMTYVCGFHIYRNGVEIISNHGSNSQTGGSTALYTIYRGHLATGSDSSAETCFPVPFMYVDSPNTTSATTYQIYMNSGWNTGVNSLYINNRASLDMLSNSWMQVTEVAQ